VNTSKPNNNRAGWLHFFFESCTTLLTGIAGAVLVAVTLLAVTLARQLLRASARLITSGAVSLAELERMEDWDNFTRFTRLAQAAYGPIRTTAERLRQQKDSTATAERHHSDHKGGLL
jgi:hypothetical protein